MTRNSRRLQKAVQAIFNDYREKASCPGQVYQNAACGCDNALQMWRGPKGEKGDQGPQGPKGDNAGSFLVDAEFVVDPEGQEPGAYLKLVLIDVAQQEQVVYVDLSYLTDIYEGGNGISIVDMVVAARLGAGLTFDQQGNIASAYQFCDGLDETSNVVKVRLDSSNRILGFASGTCGGLTATVGLAPSATGVNLVLTGANGAVLSTIPLEGGTGITVQKNAQTGGFTWLADPAGLVSSQTGNQLSVSQTDNKLYVGGNTLEYTFGTGAFTLKDSSGATISSVTVPTAVKSLERADMVCTGENAPYLHLTFKRDNGQNIYQDVDMSCLTDALDAVTGSVSCGGSYTWYISALHPWCDTEGDDCGGNVYSAPVVMPSLGTDIVMPAKILEKYSSVDIVISTAPISIITTDTSPTEFKYVTDAAHADAPYMAYELYSPYGAYYSFISAEEWAAASVGDLVELVSGRNVVEEHRAFKGAGNFDGSQLPPMQQCPLSDIPFRVFVVKETDSAIPDWPTGDIHIRVLQREGVEIPADTPSLVLTSTRTDGSTSTQTIDMSCFATAELSLDARCEDIVITPGTAEPFDDYILSGSINTLLLEQDGTISDLKHANAIPDSSAARGSVTMELFNPESTDGLSIELYAKQSSRSDSQNYYSNITPDAEDPQKCATLADFLDVGEQGLPLSYADEIPLSGVTPLAENETLYASVVSNGNNSYTFTFTVRTPEVKETRLILDLVSGENRTDLKPLLEHVGGKVDMVAVPSGDAVQLSFGYAGAGYIFGSRRSDFPTVGLFANSAEDICAQTNLIQPTSVGPGADTFTYYFETLPTHFAIPSISEVDTTGTKVGTTSYAPPMLDMETMRCTGEGTVLADIPEAGLVYTEYDTSSRPFVPTGRTLRLRATVGNAGIVFTLWQQETVDKPVLCLEPSCDSCIDLSPVMDTVDEMIDGALAPIQEQVTQNASDIDALETKTDITNKNVANIQALLNGTLYREETDSTAAYSKAVPSSAMPWASVDMLGGRTVVWNQLCKITYPGAVWNGITITVTNNDVMSFVGTAEASTYANLQTFSLPVGHIILCVQKTTVSHSGNEGLDITINNGTDEKYGTASYIFTVTSANTHIRFKTVSGNEYNDEATVRFIDLTLMFGAGNEPATVAEFEALFPSIDPAYNAGELMSAGVTEAVSEGRNILNSDGWTVHGRYYGYTANPYAETLTLSVTDRDTTVSISGMYFGFLNADYNALGDVSWVVLNGAVVGNGTKTSSLPNIVVYPETENVKTAIFSRFNIQLERGSTATAYTPYRTPIFYPVPSQIRALPGYGWSAGSVFNYVDYERKVYVQNVGSVVLDGSTDENIILQTAYNGTTSVHQIFRADVPGMKTSTPPLPLIENIVCSWCEMKSVRDGEENNAWTSRKRSAYSQVFFFAPSNLQDTVTLDAFKAILAANPVTLYYELATPVETDISQYLSDDNLINVEAGGTLTFRNQNGDDFRLPVPNEETYIIDIQEAVSNG